MPGRISVIAAAALGGSLLSFGPGLPKAEGTGGTTSSKNTAAVVAEPRVAVMEEAVDEEAWPPPGVRATGAAVPADVRLDVAPQAGGGLWIQVTRKGHLVALRHRGASSAGRSFASLQLTPLPGAKAPERDALVWEATDPERLETTRGLVLLEGGGNDNDNDKNAPRATLALAEAPRRGAALRGKERAHECAAHEDGAGGFVVICRIGKEARGARAVNVAGARPLEGAWMMETGAGGAGGALARLELARGAGLAEARALTYVRGLTAVVVRAEAVWRPGAEATLVLDEARRAQPTIETTVSWR